jgi:rare lipoprotein A
MLKKIRSVAIYVVYSLVSVMATDALAIETGLASYYSDKFQGRKTASGQRYDRNKLTAAHRTLPIGSQIEVTNLKNQSSVIVTINDRGPYSGHRKLDLSYAAAKELGLDIAGVAPVSFDLVEPAKKDSDFEKAIPPEYSPLEFAKSEEEVIEAEEELVNSETEQTQDSDDEAEQASKTHHKKHKAKKHEVTFEKVATSEKNAKMSNSKAHEVAKSEKAAKIKRVSLSDKSPQRGMGKSKKLTKSKKA